MESCLLAFLIYYLFDTALTAENTFFLMKNDSKNSIRIGHHLTLSQSADRYCNNDNRNVVLLMTRVARSFFGVLIMIRRAIFKQNNLKLG